MEERDEMMPSSYDSQDDYQSINTNNSIYFEIYAGDCIVINFFYLIVRRPRTGYALHFWWRIQLHRR